MQYGRHSDPCRVPLFEFPLLLSPMIFEQTILKDGYLESQEGEQRVRYDFPSGTVLVSDVQTKGRGRGQNTWDSPEGCLMFTYIARHADGNTLPLIQMIVSMAIVEAIAALTAVRFLERGQKRNACRDFGLE